MEQKELTEKAKELYLMLLISDPKYPIQIYRDSLCILGAVIRSEKEPSEIPYPLFSPIRNDLSNMEYAIAWMQQAILENLILRCFPKDIFEVLPQTERNAPVNFCEGVLYHATGRILLKQDPFGLFLSDVEVDTIYRRFYELGEEKSIAHLNAAGETLCRALNLSQSEGKTKVKAVVNSLYQRCMTDERNTVFRFILPTRKSKKNLFYDA